MSAQNEKLDNLLSTVKKLEDEKSLLEEKIKKEREEIITILEKETDGQYKNEIATVAYVERKTVKFQDKESVLNNLKNSNLVKYIDVIPEHQEINKKFEKDVKSGDFSIEGVEVSVMKLPQIRFVK